MRNGAVVSYGNAKVDALLDGHISIAQGTFTTADFAALCLAAADQAGSSVAQQDEIAAQLPECPHGDCGSAYGNHLGHDGKHDGGCEDGSCCEPPELDAETVAAMREHHFGEGR